MSLFSPLLFRENNQGFDLCQTVNRLPETCFDTKKYSEQIAITEFEKSENYSHKEQLSAYI